MLIKDTRFTFRNVKESEVLHHQRLISSIKIERQLLKQEIIDIHLIPRLAKYRHFTESVAIKLKFMGFWKRLELLEKVRL